MQIRCSTHSVILNVMVTQYTCSLNGIYHPHSLVHCSHMCTPIHSLWLQGYIDVAQTIFVILTMVGLFPGRPYKLQNLCFPVLQAQSLRSGLSVCLSEGSLPSHMAEGARDLSEACFVKTNPVPEGSTLTTKTLFRSPYPYLWGLGFLRMNFGRTKNIQTM